MKRACSFLIKNCTKNLIKIRICESEERTVPYVLKFLISLFQIIIKFLTDESIKK